MSSLIEGMKDAPSMSPIAALILLFVVPCVLLLLAYKLFESSAENISCPTLFKFVENHALKLLILNFFVVMVLLINQILLIQMENIEIGLDISYYLRVNVGEYDNTVAINLASDQNCFNKIKNSDSRRLSSSNSMVIIYHTTSWDDLLQSSELQKICQNEKNVLLNMKCIDSTYRYSIIQNIFVDADCSSTIQVSSDQFREFILMPENQIFFQNNLDRNNPKSSIILSYFKSISCDSLSVQTFQSKLSDLIGNNIKYSYIENNLIEEEFINAVFNALYLSALAIMASIIVTFICLHGIFITIMTYFSIFVSLIFAAGFLPLGGYGNFSAFNILSLYILIGVGGATLLLFNHAWNEQLDVSTADFNCRLYRSYQTVGKPALFAAMATCLSVFSKMVSPVVVISQLGLFMGISYVVYYILLHIILIPAYLFSKRYVWCRQEQSYITTIKIPATSNVTHNIRGIEDDNNSICEYEDCSEDISASNFQESKTHDEEQEIPARFPEQVSEHSFTKDNCLEKCYSKWFEKIPSRGLAALFLLLISMILIFFLMLPKFSINAGIPLLFPISSNLGQLLYIANNFKSDILSSTSGYSDSSSTPASLNHSVPSSAPTISLSGMPTLYQSYSPTIASYSFTSPSVPHTDYMLTGCWGISTSKKYIDEDVQV